MPRHVDARQLDAILEHERDSRGSDASASTGCGFDPRDVAEVLLRQLERAFAVDVAGSASDAFAGW
jgi:hypothetical protein